jgi:hypothetical protein
MKWWHIVSEHKIELHMRTNQLHVHDEKKELSGQMVSLQKKHDESNRDLSNESFKRIHAEIRLIST